MVAMCVGKPFSALGFFSFFAATVLVALAEEDDEYEYEYRARGDFNYRSDSDKGPHNWANLDLDHNECGGQSNSPIAVPDMQCTDYEDYSFEYGNCTFYEMEFVINNNGVEGKYDTSHCVGNKLQIPGVPGTYEAIQFHIHTNSEHTIDGKNYGAELHVVHINRDAVPLRFAVVGIMIMPDSPNDNELFAPVLDRWVEIYNEQADLCGSANARRLQESDVHPDKLIPFDIYALLPKDTGFYHYFGGLTTPPCSEVVWWNLAREPLTISPRQFNRLFEVILSHRRFPDCEVISIASASGSTSRPPQPLNGRSVQFICPKS